MNTSDGSETMPLIEQLYDELTVVFEKDSALNFLAVMQEDDPDTIALALKLVTTGSEAARYLVQLRVDSAIVEISEAQYLDGDNTWRDRCRSELSPRIKNRMSAAWHVANVIEEFGPASIKREYSYYEREMNQLHHIIFNNNDSDLSRDDSYWRGLAALALTNLSYGAGGVQSNYYRAFVSYAGKRNDIARIIRLASERRLLNPEALEGIIQEQNENPAAALSKGIL